MKPNLRLLGAGVAGLLTATLSGGAAWLLWLRLSSTLRRSPVLEVEQATAAGLLAVGALVAAWYTLSAAAGTACLVVRALGGIWTAGERSIRRLGAPGMGRLLGAGAGAVLSAALLAGPAHASPGPVPDDLAWGATVSAPDDEEPAAEPAAPEEPAGGIHQQGRLSPPAPGGPSRAAPDRAPGGHQVAPGESLWSIAADALGPGATTADIAEAWPRWYAANRDVLGPDPDLIHPGDHLVAPSEESTR
ncbi:LysM peptidoglycan-binding domain-containing protein [Ruania suaedae]|uniref:LysM peptidoglycan-binding domain-containing protein n=1 Tax=Ruania suaedae TaxID=2897774 RepID=UPI001E534E55|nr:LysM domain-containing protein [Ruania suaedae]UFU02173.1 LysM peptidoglycan-binding domain-containing protein [Ruania suaedae]